MHNKEYANLTTENVTGAFGVMAGIEYGAVLGSSFMPGVGTVLGAVVGGMLGDRLGRRAGTMAGTTIFNSQMAQNALNGNKEMSEIH